MNIKEFLTNFVKQSEAGDLKTVNYPKEWGGLKVKVSFGMGSPARVPWIAFTVPELSVSNGYYPVYLYFKSVKKLILSYGISETNEYQDTWPAEISNNADTIQRFLGTNNAPRYKDSYVFKSYDVAISAENIELKNTDTQVEINNAELESDLDQILTKYIELTQFQTQNPTSIVSQGMFYLEKQLEDFLIQNWANTELGQKYDLIIEDGELRSQQYRTDIGPIDILAKDKTSGSHVVIELKKNQTSDDTIGQVARYMGWVDERLNDKAVKGIIIAKGYDQKLEYALKHISGVSVYIYEIDFRLVEFKT